MYKHAQFKDHILTSPLRPSIQRLLVLMFVAGALSCTESCGEKDEDKPTPAKCGFLQLGVVKRCDTHQTSTVICVCSTNQCAQRVPAHAPETSASCTSSFMYVDEDGAPTGVCVHESDTQTQGVHWVDHSSPFGDGQLCPPQLPSTIEDMSTDADAGDESVDNVDVGVDTNAPDMLEVDLSDSRDMVDIGGD